MIQRKYKEMLDSKSRKLSVVGLDKEDLFQEFSLSLWRAIQKYDPLLGITEEYYIQSHLNKTYKQLLRNFMNKKQIKYLTCSFCHAKIMPYSTGVCAECGRTERVKHWAQQAPLSEINNSYSETELINNLEDIKLFIKHLSKPLQSTIIKVITDQKLESIDYKRLQRNKEQLKISMKRYVLCQE